MAKNSRGVSAKQWKKWGPFGQAQFNRTYRALMAARHHLLPDGQLTFQQERILIWNAAFLAACEAASILKDCSRTGQLG